MVELSYQNVAPEKYSLKIRLGANSKFYNQGRWYNFIEPLLPKDCKDRSFLEIGCNAGMYLKMATDKGFNRVVGVDRDKHVIEQAKYYKRQIGYNYKLIRRRMGHWNCQYNDLPMADVALLACVHYHMRPIELVELLDHLKKTALYCIVVSVRDVKRTRVNRVGGSEYEVMKYFSDWERMETITLNDDNDPKPRLMFSVLFKSGLKRYRIKDLLYPQAYNKKLRAHKYKTEFTGFIDRIVKNKNVRKTEFFQHYIKGIGKSSRLMGARLERFNKLKVTIRDIRDNGMKKPILVNRRGHMLDGSHRIILLEYLGYEYVIGREL